MIQFLFFGPLEYHFPNKKNKALNKRTGNKKIICSVCHKSNSQNKGLKCPHATPLFIKMYKTHTVYDFLTKYPKIFTGNAWHVKILKHEIFTCKAIMKYNISI